MLVPLGERKVNVLKNKETKDSGFTILSPTFSPQK